MGLPLLKRSVLSTWYQAFDALAGDLLLVGIDYLFCDSNPVLPPETRSKFLSSFFVVFTPVESSIFPASRSEKRAGKLRKNPLKEWKKTQWTPNSLQQYLWKFMAHWVP